ncbi:ribonuclease H family protein [Lactobacillus xylocopicola]|uniref:ribonuclease H n=1 Tax=Lactobacillus xylocopicola TaxID=2976676 RepID=A0ABN6SII0_9LACO|nr:ribonuclease H family protein [Lactobacillus xylocopicola]BDR59869.1 ribonuclease H [Lactobacillus xylocopicola]
MKFYAVRKGRKPGVYRTWAAAKEQVEGFSGAEYKSFTKVTDATEYLNWNQRKINQVFQKDEEALERAIAKIQQTSRTVNQVSQDQAGRREPAAKKSKPGGYFATTYTDGGTRNTGNYKGGHVRTTDKAAWAYLIEWQDHGQQQTVHDANGELGATNNKMELTALIEALKKLLELGFNQKPLLFVLDSQYVLNPITKGWLKGWKKRGWKKSTPGEIANLECWQKLDQLLEQFSQSHFEWTKGHANNRGNEYVDHALNEVMDQM